MNIAVFLLAAVASVTETELEFKTYPYSDPDPVPATDRSRYPYHFFDGTTNDAVTRKWKAVVLENDSIRVTVLPEIGGKVHGAVDKRTGRDFIYSNGVVKFRNIAIRGPWCSGGIEWNFGLVGHGMWTASPVSYFTRRNADGSASCFVADHDFVTGTDWQVEIVVPAEGESFFTRATWYNDSFLPTFCYSWMNAAYSVRGNPRFEYPGSASIGHQGEVDSWPVTSRGRDESVFANNDAKGSTSVHVVNGDNSVYGIWWGGEGTNGFGSVHRSGITERYGRKIWLWPLSRAGGIWEDLLTDSDGQYTELQSGRGFNQPEGESWRTPFKFPALAPAMTETLEDEWGVVRDRAVFDARFNETNYVSRPLESPADFDWNSVYGRFLAAEQHIRVHDYAAGDAELAESLELDGGFAPALVLAARRAIDRAEYAKAREFAARALAIDAYDVGANYFDALAAFERGELRVAEERAGVAAFEPEYRAAAYLVAAMAELRGGDCRAALRLLSKSRDSDRRGALSRVLEAAAYRRLGETARTERLVKELLEEQPLCHAARFELELLGEGGDFLESVKGEFPAATVVSIGDFYERAGLYAEAEALYRRVAGKDFIASVRLAKLLAGTGRAEAAESALAGAAKMRIAFVFPFRRTSLPAFDYAAAKGGSWKFAYARAVLLAALGRTDEAKTALAAIGDAPDDAIFYSYRARFLNGEAKLRDLERADELAPSWRTGLALYAYHREAGDSAKALSIVERCARETPSNPVNIDYANALVAAGRDDDAIAFLRRTTFLPSEHGDNASGAWIDAWRHKAETALDRGDEASARAAVAEAVSYPENLGLGRPYRLDFDSPGRGRKRNGLYGWPMRLRRLVDPALAAEPENATATRGNAEAKARWESEERPRIKKILLDEVYGNRPASLEQLAHLEFTAAEQDLVMMDGRAVRKRIRCEYGNEYGTNAFVFTAFIPTANRKSAAFLLICNRPPDENIDPERIRKSDFWPAEEIVGRGYAAIAFFSGDIAPDFDHGNTLGVFALDPEGIRGERSARDHRWGMLSAWAWGASRVMDWVETEPAIDASKVAIVGHSRCGKTALVAGMTDGRFAMIAANDSGCCGAKKNRMNLPKSEHFSDIVRRFDYWFTPQFRTWVNRDERLPWDQDALIGMCAPRLVAIGSAAGDDWAGPAGEKASAVEASRFWRIYGKTGFGEEIDYHIRPGIHDLTLVDWRRYLDFADRHGWRAENPAK